LHKTMRCTDLRDWATWRNENSPIFLVIFPVVIFRVSGVRRNLRAGNVWKSFGPVGYYPTHFFLSFLVMTSLYLVSVGLEVTVALDHTQTHDTR
jgi:hypothetical protein